MSNSISRIRVPQTDRAQRFRSILYDGMCDPICGLMRRDVLKQTRLFGAYVDCDRVLLAEMGLRGRFSLVREHIYSRRMHAERSTTKYEDFRERTVFYDPAKAGKVIFPVFQEAVELFGAIERAKLPLGERLLCHKYFLGWAGGSAATVCAKTYTRERRHTIELYWRRTKSVDARPRIAASRKPGFHESGSVQHLRDVPRSGY